MNKICIQKGVCTTFLFHFLVKYSLLKKGAQIFIFKKITARVLLFLID